MKLTLFAILPLLFWDLNAWATLKWDHLRADLVAAPNEKSVEAVFSFVNDGPTTVTIEAVKSSCGCTTAALDKKIYARGEKGELRARFDIGQRRGPQSKTISVKIENEPTPTILTLAVALAEPIKLKPALLVWQNGEAGEPKVITLTPQPGQTIRSVKITSNNSRMQTAVESATDTGSFSIIVKPADTVTAGFAMLTIEAELAGTTQTLHAYAQIRPAAR